MVDFKKMNSLLKICFVLFVLVLFTSIVLALGGGSSPSIVPSGTPKSPPISIPLNSGGTTGGTGGAQQPAQPTSQQPPQSCTSIISCLSSININFITQAQRLGPTS